MKLIETLRRQKNLLLIFKFILPFILVIAIPLSVSYGLGQYMIATIRNDVLKSYSILLRNNISSLDNELQQMEDTVSSMILNPGLATFFDSPAYQVSALAEVKNTLNAFHIDGAVVKNVYLYNNKTDVIVDKSGAYLSSDLFYKSVGNELGTYDGWKTQMMDRSWQSRYIPSGPDGGNPAVLTYTQSVPLRYVTMAEGKVNVVLDGMGLMHPFQEVFAGNEGSMCLLDGSGQMLLAYQERYSTYIMEHIEAFETEQENVSIEVDGKKMFMTSLTIPRTGWKAIFILPQSLVLSNVKRASALIMFINAATMLAGLIVSYIITRRKAREFNEIVGMFGPQNAAASRKAAYRDIKGSEYSLIKRGVSQLVSDNQRYQSQLDDQREHIHYTVLDKIIHGRYLDRAAMEEELKQAGLPVEADQYVFLLLHLGREYRLTIGGENVKTFVCSNLYRIIDDFIFVHEVSSRHIAILMPCAQAPEEDVYQHIRQTVSKIKTELAYVYDIEMTFGAGNICSGLMEVPEAFRQAKKVIEYNLMGYEKEALWYEELSQEGDSYCYPMSVESRLYSYAMTGNQAEVEAILDQIYTDNFVQHKLSVSTAEKLMRAVHSTVTHICVDAGVTQLTEEILDNASVADLFGSMNNVMKKVCAHLISEAGNETQKTIKQVIRYIDENFCDENLSLSDLSIRFKLSESYLSTLFKEQLGVNFSSYVEDKRIERACFLISEGKHQIADISKMVGYGSDGTFRRAFKRNKNMSPSAWAQRKDGI